MYSHSPPQALYQHPSLGPSPHDIPIWEPCHEGLGVSQPLSRTIVPSNFDDFLMAVTTPVYDLYIVYFIEGNPTQHFNESECGHSSFKNFQKRSRGQKHEENMFSSINLTATELCHDLACLQPFSLNLQTLNPGHPGLSKQ
jgi:hypothetical protein